MNNFKFINTYNNFTFIFKENGGAASNIWMDFIDKLKKLSVRIEKQSKRREFEFSWTNPKNFETAVNV